MDKPQLSEIARVQDQHGKAPYQITFRDTRSLYHFPTILSDKERKLWCTDQYLFVLYLD